MRAPSWSERGFTLLELLIVTAIVALLVAVLFPVYRPSHCSARQENCSSNLRQLATALLMYTEDYGGRMPPHAYLSPGPETALPALLAPYLKNNEVWHCPSDLDPQNRFDGRPVDGGVSYGYNWLALSPRGRGAVLENVRKPAETVALLDSRSSRATPTVFAPFCGGTPPVTRHRSKGYVTVGWLDGHAKSLPLARLEETSRAEGGDPDGPLIDAFRWWNRR